MIKEMPNRFLSHDKSTVSWITEREKDHTAWWNTLDELQYCSYQKQ